MHAGIFGASEFKIANQKQGEIFLSLCAIIYQYFLRHFVWIAPIEFWAQIMNPVCVILEQCEFYSETYRHISRDGMYLQKSKQRIICTFLGLCHVFLSSVFGYKDCLISFSHRNGYH